MASTERLPAPTITPISVDDAIVKFIKNLTIVKKRTERTVGGYATNLGRFALAAGGKTKMHMVTNDHVTKYMEYWESAGPGARGNAVTRIRTFWRWAQNRKHVSPFPWDDPTQELERERYEVQPRDPFPAYRWPELLDAAGEKHPIHRMSVAMGLYLMARGPSEIRVLTLDEFDFANWTVGVDRTKTKSATDAMKICGELRIELTRYLTWYNQWSLQRLGKELQPEWFLLPTSRRSGPDPMNRTLDPEKAVSENSICNMARWALEGCGYKTRDENGKKNRKGASHALRAFGARALYDELLERGYDGALTVVREMLGHDSTRTTELYLNLHLDRARRDKEIVRNNGFMFAHNDPASEKPVDLNTARLPASLTGAVVLGGASNMRLAEVERAAEALPRFLRVA